MKIAGVIPARYNSSRLRGKPLADICGRPMIWWVYSSVSGIDRFDGIYAATDDARIEKVCREYGIPVVMTSDKHRTAAERLHEVSEKIPADFYVQINGDEPLIDRNAVLAAIPDEVITGEEFGTNIITEMTDPAQVTDSSNIKVVFSEDMYALYMSRTPVPYPFGAIDFKYYKHIGIIGYNKKMLDFYANSVPGRLETIEGIDTLRFLDYGKKLRLSIVSGYECLSVDTEKDLEAVRLIMESRTRKNIGDKR